MARRASTPDPVRDDGPAPVPAAGGGSLSLTHLFGGIAHYLPGEIFGPRRIPDYELVWIIQGGAVYESDGREHPVGPGGLVLARPGIRERYLWDRQQTTVHAFFHWAFGHLPAHWPRPEDWPVTVQLPAGDVVRPLFRYVVSHCVALFHPDGRGSREVAPQLRAAVETLLGAVLVGPLTLRPQPLKPQPVPVRKAILWAAQTMDRSPESPITLDQLAHAAAVTPKHLCRLFTTALGVSPMHSLRLMRLERSVSMLGRSNLSIKEIAARCGFASPFHFSRAFRQTFGKPPRVVRREIEAGGVPPGLPLSLDVPSAVGW